MKNAKIKERVVTRTIKINTCDCMYVNLTTRTLFNKEIQIIGNYTDEQVKTLAAAYTVDNAVFVQVENITATNKLYALSEDEFVKHGKPIEKASEDGTTEDGTTEDGTTEDGTTED